MEASTMVYKSFFSRPSQVGRKPNSSSSATMRELVGEGFWSVEKLATSFKWELRTLWLIPVGGIAFYVSYNAAFVCIVVGAVVTFISDTHFSIVVTGVFLR
jgi:hypothetical protein